MRSTKIIKICSSSLCTCLHHMIILRTRNKITDFMMILAWASPFNYDVIINAQMSCCMVPGMTGPPNSFTARGPVTLTAILFPQPVV